MHLVIVTGASKGIGLAVAKALACEIKTAVHFVFVFRSSAKNNEVYDAILSCRKNEQSKIDFVNGDLSNSSEIENMSRMIFQSGKGDYSEIIFVNNAGSLGPIHKIGVETSSSEYFRLSNLHVVAPMVMCSELLRVFSDPKVKIHIINMSSLWAISPSPFFSIYCSTKAASEMYFKVLAAETIGRNVRILNYAPGPVDTEMQEAIRGSLHLDPSVASIFITLHENGQLVDPNITAQKCVRLVINESFESGAHVDYYDV